MDHRRLHIRTSAANACQQRAAFSNGLLRGAAIPRKQAIVHVARLRSSAPATTNEGTPSHVPQRTALLLFPFAFILVTTFGHSVSARTICSCEGKSQNVVGRHNLRLFISLKGMSSSLPEPGQIVIVRQRPFVVSDIQASSLPQPATAQQPITRQHLLILSSVEDEGLGEELSVVWELEPGTACLEKARLPDLKDFDNPRTFDAFLDAVAWGSVSSADDKALQAPFRSGIDVDDYQLDPVHAARKSSRRR
jgi:hypothetical protein